MMLFHIVFAHRDFSLPSQSAVAAFDRATVAQSKALLKRGKRLLPEGTGVASWESASRPPKRSNSQAGSGRDSNIVLVGETRKSPRFGPAHEPQLSFNDRVARDTLSSQRGAVPHHQYQLRTRIVWEMLDAYWNKYGPRILQLARGQRLGAYLRSRKERQDAVRATELRVRQRLDQDLADFLRPKAGQSALENQQAREGLWRRFRSNWKHKEIGEQEYTKLPHQTSGDFLDERFRSIFEAHARIYINRIEAQGDAVLFRRRSDEPRILFLGEVVEKAVTDPERMAEVAAARAAEDFALTVFPSSCNTAGFKRAVFSSARSKMNLPGV